MIDFCSIMNAVNKISFSFFFFKKEGRGSSVRREF